MRKLTLTAERVYRVLVNGYDKSGDPWIECAVRLLARREYEMIRKGICPFCGRRGIHVHHFTQGRCKDRIMRFCYWVAEELVRARRVIRRDNGVYKVFVCNPAAKAETLYEALRLAIGWLRSEP